jgi:hypothetical protein
MPDLTRKPWEMTREEWASTTRPSRVQERLTPEQRATAAAAHALGHRQRGATHAAPYWTVPGSNVAYPTKKAAQAWGHRDAVEQALALGEAVPAKVLAERAAMEGE